MPVMRNDPEHRAQRVESEMTDRRTPGEHSVAFEVQRQIHRIQAVIQQPATPQTREGRINGRDVVPDVMSNDHAVAQILEKPGQRGGLLDPTPGLIPCDAVNGYGFSVVLNPNQRRERVIEQDLAVEHSDRSDRDQPIDSRVETRRLGIEHDEADPIDRLVGAP